MTFSYIEVRAPCTLVPYVSSLQEFDNDAERILTVTSLFVGKTGTNATDEEDENESSTVVGDDSELESKLMLALYDSYWRRLQRRRKVK